MRVTYRRGQAHLPNLRGSEGSALTSRPLKSILKKLSSYESQRNSPNLKVGKGGLPPLVALQHSPVQLASGIRDLRVGHRRGQAHLPNLIGFHVPLLLLQGQFVACALADRGSTGRFEFCHASQPPTSARAFDQPACLSSCATRALVASFGQAQ